MCGLVGFAGTIDAKHEKAFRTLLVLDSLRGEHSTGVYAVSRSAQPIMLKKVGSPFELFETAGWEKIMKRQSLLLLGHNRYATQGVVNRENAHPFEFNHIVGAHNGTLTNKWELPEGNEFAVDSQALYNLISKVGVKEAISKAKGAWALTFFNSDTHEINFLRNKERPLYIAQTTDDKTIVWASEKWMISVACSREGIAIHDIVELAPDTLFSVQIPDANKVFEQVKQEGGVTGAPFVQQGQVFTVVNGGSKGSSKQAPKLTPVLDAPKVMGKEVLSNRKGLVFLVDSLQKDIHGNLYAECTFPNQAYPIRLYVKSQAEYDKIDGEYIQADTGPLFHGVDKTFYYKLAASSYRILSHEEAYEARGGAKPSLFKDKQGNPMPQAEWEHAFGTCCWCNGNISPTSNYKWAKYSDSAVCEDCAEDSEVMGYLS